MANDKILERVRALLAIAEHPNTPEAEADTALNQANRLMAKHAIDEAMARQAQTLSERRAIERRAVKLNRGQHTEFLINMQGVLAAIAAANRVSVVLLRGQGWSVELFGTHEDVQWVEDLYTRVYFQFVSKVNPRWDEAKSWDENVYNFKVGGFKWFDINEESMKHGHEDMRVYRGEEYNWRTGQVEPKMTGQVKTKMVNAYKRHAASIGDTNTIVTAKHQHYRRDFADGFENRIRNRMWGLQVSQREEADSIPGAAVALRDLSEDVKHAMWDAHPEISPEARAERRRQQEEFEARQLAERNAMLDAMTEKQRYEFLEKERRAEERAEDRWQKSIRNQRRTDRSAQMAGKRAAEGVVLDRNAGATTQGAARGELA